MAAAWRVQFYYTLALILAVIIQRFQGQISLFHEFAAFNLAYIALMSGATALGSSSTVYRRQKDIPFEARARAQVVTIPSSRPISRPNKTVYIVTHAPQTALLMVQGGRVVLLLLICGETWSLSKGCLANEDVEGSKENQLWWWFLGVKINMVKSFYVLLVVFCGDMLLRCFELTRWFLGWACGIRGPSVRLFRQIIEFVVMVMGIEVSIKINHLDGAENVLGFGQVSVRCCSSVFVFLSPTYSDHPSCPPDSGVRSMVGRAIR